MDIDKNKVCDLVDNFCLILKLSEKTKNDARAIVGGIDPKKHINIVWAEYDEIAASVVYIGSIIHGERVTQKKIQKECNVPIHRIRKIHHEIIKKIDIIDLCEGI